MRLLQPSAAPCGRAALTILTAVALALPGHAAGAKPAVHRTRLAQHEACVAQARMHARMRQGVTPEPQAPSRLVGMGRALTRSLPILLLAAAYQGLVPEAVDLPLAAPFPEVSSAGPVARTASFLEESLAPCAPLANLEPAPVLAAPVQVMGLGTLRCDDPRLGARNLEVGFTVEDSLGLAMGYLSLKDPGLAFTYSGTARNLEVLERDPGGSPQRLRITGTAQGHEDAPFTLTVTAGGQGGQAGRLELALGGARPLALPEAPLTSGYLTINGVQQRGRARGAVDWGGWQSSGQRP